LEVRNVCACPKIGLLLVRETLAADEVHLAPEDVQPQSPGGVDESDLADGAAHDEPAEVLEPAVERGRRELSRAERGPDLILDLAHESVHNRGGVPGLLMLNREQALLVVAVGEDRPDRATGHEHPGDQGDEHHRIPPKGTMSFGAKRHSCVTPGKPLPRSDRSVGIRRPRCRAPEETASTPDDRRRQEPVLRHGYRPADPDSWDLGGRSPRSPAAGWAPGS